MLSTLVNSVQQTEILNEHRKGFIQKVPVANFSRNSFEGNKALKVNFLTGLFSKITGVKQCWCSEVVDCERNNHNHKAEFRNVAQNKDEFNHNLDQSFQNTPKTILPLLPLLLKEEQLTKTRELLGRNVNLWWIILRMFDHAANFCGNMQLIIQKHLREPVKINFSLCSQPLRNPQN